MKFLNESCADEVFAEMLKIDGQSLVKKASIGKEEAIELLISAAQDLKEIGETNKFIKIVRLAEKISNKATGDTEEKEMWKMYGYEADDVEWEDED